MTNKGLVKQSTQTVRGITPFDDISNLEKFEALVDYIANSEIYNKNFLVNEIVDGNPTGLKVVNKHSIATCLLLGNELGFKHMESIVLGRRLNDEAVIKVHRGKDLGLSPMTALQNIYVWKGGSDREIVYTGIHVIYKCLNEANVRIEVIDDGTKPYYYYVNQVTNEILPEYNPRVHVLLNGELPIEEIEQGLKDKLIKILRRQTYRGLVKLTRGTESIAIPFTLMQAVEAGLYRGKDSTGADVKGKDNWNKYPAAHLVKMSVINGARIIIGDRLNGKIYIQEEISFITDAARNAEEAESSVVG